MTIHRYEKDTVYIYGGVTYRVSNDELEKYARLTKQTRDDLTSSAFLLLAKNHPLYDVFSVYQIIEMAKAGTIEPLDPNDAN